MNGTSFIQAPLLAAEAASLIEEETSQFRDINYTLPTGARLGEVP
jgi:hypothetical protein